MLKSMRIVVEETLEKEIYDVDSVELAKESAIETMEELDTGDLQDVERKLECIYEEDGEILADINITGSLYVTLGCGYDEDEKTFEEIICDFDLGDLCNPYFSVEEDDEF